MEYLANKLGPIARSASINKFRSKKEQQQDRSKRTTSDEGHQVSNNETVEMTDQNNSRLSAAGRQDTPSHISIRSPSADSGMPLGGESSRNLFSPPPIGFRDDFLKPQSQLQDKRREPAFNGQKSGSDDSLYQGDGWTRLWFQRVLLISLTRLLLFIRKIYEDFQSTKTHSLSEHAGYLLIAGAALFMPTVVYTIYRVSWYLQLTLPTFRQNSRSLGQQPQKVDDRGQTGDEDAQITEALMSSPDDGIRSKTNSPTQTDDGLVTARQSPNQDDFQDSKSQQEQAGSTVGQQPTRRGNEDHLAIVAVRTSPKLESVDIDKLGDLPDKETTRVVIGSSEQLLHGVLYIFWQLKRQVDVMAYLVERACLWRKPRESEKEELNRLSITSDHLEWFEDFYAAFLAITIEVYKLGIYWSLGSNVAMTSSSTANVGKAGDSFEGIGIKASAQAVATVIAPTRNGAPPDKDLLIISQLIVSSCVITSLLVAVRRRDDGILHVGLSMIGWGSLFAARILIIALAFVHIGWYIILPFILLHVIGITSWIYKISMDSHNDAPSERVTEAMYDDDVADELEAIKREQKSNMDNVPAAATTIKETSTWSALEHLVLITQIFFLFSIPSLFYWPVMFNLNTHARPYKYLLLILTQNFLLIPSTWYLIANPTPGQLYLLGAVAAFSVIGFMFISCYVLLKPKLTEYFAYADVKFNQAETCGIYYEFCSRVFKLPDLSKASFGRFTNQTARIVEEQTVEVPLDD